VAESVRLYGERFFPSLVLGVPAAVLDQLWIGHSVEARIAIFLAFAPLFTATYAVAVALVTNVRPPASAWARALAAGTLVFLPAAFFFPWFALLALAWLAFAGLTVPAALVEGLGVRASLRRGMKLGRVDYVHALGSLATLVIVYALVRILLALLLRSQADNTLRVAVFLSDVILSPIIFLGAALLYVDQEARSRIGRGEPLPRR
jgi:hypothetical protein